MYECMMIETDFPDFSTGNIDEPDIWKLFIPSDLRQCVIYAYHDETNSSHER